MPRTTLFETLVRIARDHAEAERRGIDVETLRSERVARSVSRRAFIGADGAAAAVLAIPRIARASGTPPRVAIVGAGISGLSAALTLADARFSPTVTVYEATGRLGGRMYSNSPAVSGAYWDEGQATEWCGELIDSAHVTIMGLAKRYAIPLDDIIKVEPAGSTPVYFFGGKYYTFAEVNKDFPPVFKVLQADSAAAIPAKKSDGTKNTDGTVLYDAITPAGVVLDNTSVYDWIEKKVPGGHASNLGKLLDAAYASEYGADTKDQSSLNLVLLLSGLPKANPFIPFGLSDERFHTHGGNQLIPLAIAEDLTDRKAATIEMNSTLTKIVKNSDGSSTLTFSVASGGSTTKKEVTADAVILTLPFAVMADAVDYGQAGFDARKTTAIKDLGRGLCSRLQLQFTKRLWESMGAWGINNGEETFSDNGDQCSWEPTRGQAGKAGILNGYTGGTPTVDRAKVAPVAFGKVNLGPMGSGIATLGTTLLGQLDQIFPGVKALYNGKATLSLPHLAPNFKLAYSYWKVGQYQAFAGYERAPQGNIFFAGEHTSVNDQGYMEGGAAEGVRAAKEVMAGVPMMLGSGGGDGGADGGGGGSATNNGGGCAESPSRPTAGSALPIAAAVLAGLAIKARSKG